MPRETTRQHERYPLQVTIRVGPAAETDPLKQICYETTNVSAGGALLKTPSPLPVGTEVNIELELPLDAIRDIVTQKAKIQLRGSVVRQEEGGMGRLLQRQVYGDPGGKLTTPENRALSRGLRRRLMRSMRSLFISVSIIFTSSSLPGEPT